MDGDLSSARIEALLAHREWVRRVALLLTADENAAADLEQDLWVEVLDHPPQPRTSIRGWLATALRRDLLDQRRSDRRRLRREQVAARPEETSSAGDLVAEADAQRRVVQAVVELEEPYRTTVLLRWFEDLKPGEIARRQGVPVETVRTRLRRAIERLREMLMGDAGGDRTAFLAALLPLARRARGSELAGGSGMAATLGGILMGTGTKVAVAAGAVAVAGLLAWWFVPGTDNGTGTQRSEAIAVRSTGKASVASTSVRPDAAVAVGGEPPLSAAAGPDPAGATNPAGKPAPVAPWTSLLARQRAVVRKLQVTVLPKQEWSGDATLEGRLRVLEKDIGVPISWDARLPGSFAAAPVLAMFDGASAWYALEFVTAYKGAPLRITGDGVQFVPAESVRDPALLEHYKEDPFAALALAREFIEEDKRFHPRWASIADCENTPVHLGALDPDATWMDLQGALTNSARLTLEWHLPMNPASPLPGSAGLRSGTAMEVVRSWCAGLEKVSVITGRTGIEVWPEGEGARARAADKVAYEGFRVLLGRTPCALPEGKTTLAQVVAELGRVTEARVLLDPAVAGTEVEVGPADYYLRILDRLMAERDAPRGPGVGWTWLGGWMVITTTRARESLSPQEPPAGK